MWNFTTKQDKIYTTPLVANWLKIFIFTISHSSGSMNFNITTLKCFYIAAPNQVLHTQANKVVEILATCFLKVERVLISILIDSRELNFSPTWRCQWNSNPGTIAVQIWMYICKIHIIISCAIKTCLVPRHTQELGNEARSRHAWD